tara:strand:+ start:443 stop:694 length:252 start_codon:yes stop_codon:yes gene_type:complete
MKVMTDTAKKLDKVVDELIVKHLKNLRDGYNNRMDQLMQMKEQLVLQSEQATANLELLQTEVDLVEQNLQDLVELIGPEEEEE